MNNSTFYFESPKFLFLLLLLILAWLFLSFRWKHCKQGLMLLAGESIRAFFKLRVIFWSLGWIFLSISLASPFFGTTTQTEKRQGASVFIVFDISESMNSVDCSVIKNSKLTKVSRLSFSKVWSKKLLESLNDVPIGFILAKGKPTLSIPLTQDKQIMNTVLSQLSTKISGFPGTDLGSAITMASNQLSSATGTKNSIIVITDGGDLEGSLLSSVAKVPEDINLVFVGVGEYTPVPVPKENGELLREKSGEVVRTVLQSEELQKAAELAGGNYFFGNNEDSVYKVSELICSSEIMNGTYVSTKKSKSCRWIFILLTLLSLFAGFVCQNRKHKKNFSQLSIIFSVCLVAFFSTACSEVKTSYYVLDGYLNWKSGEYDLAIVDFMKAQEEATLQENESAKAYAKLGLALSYLQQNEEAVAFEMLQELVAYAKSQNDKVLLQNSLFTAGTTAYQKADYENACKYFSEVIVAGDNSYEVRQNLELSQKALEVSKQTNSKQSSAQSSIGKAEGDKTMFDIFSEKEFNLWSSPQESIEDTGILDY